MWKGEQQLALLCSYRSSATGARLTNPQAAPASSAGAGGLTAAPPVRLPPSRRPDMEKSGVSAPVKVRDVFHKVSMVQKFVKRLSEGSKNGKNYLL